MKPIIAKELHTQLPPLNQQTPNLFRSPLIGMEVAGTAPVYSRIYADRTSVISYH